MAGTRTVSEFRRLALDVAALSGEPPAAADELVDLNSGEIVAPPEATYENPYVALS